MDTSTVLWHKSKGKYVMCAFSDYAGREICATPAIFVVAYVYDKEEENNCTFWEISWIHSLSLLELRDIFMAIFQIQHKNHLQSMLYVRTLCCKLRVMTLMTLVTSDNLV